jgi:hypothetical protein
MKKYKVYAKILGHVLPEEELEIGNCKIEKMSYREQKERNFRPLSGWKLREYNMNYMTFPRGADFRIMRSNFVISTVIEESSPNEALGLAIFLFDKIIGAFMLYMNYWWSEKHPRLKDDLSDYDYQICKLYEIVDGKEIEIKNFGPASSSASMCHYPTSGDLTDSFRKITDQCINCKDEIFERSMEYFVDGIKGMKLFLPEEKIFLDLFKSIEIVVKGLKIKRKNFRDKLRVGLKKLGLDDKEIDEIIKFYNIRCDGNFAHAGIKRINFMFQYPIPHDGGFLFDISQLKYLSHKVLVNYFKYIKDRYEILINNSAYNSINHDNELVLIIENFPMDSWNHKFAFNTKERNKRKLTPLIKKEFAKEFRTKINQIKVLENKNDKMILTLK